MKTRVNEIQCPYCDEVRSDLDYNAMINGEEREEQCKSCSNIFLVKCERKNDWDNIYKTYKQDQTQEAIE